LVDIFNFNKIASYILCKANRRSLNEHLRNAQNMKIREYEMIIRKKFSREKIE